MYNAFSESQETQFLVNITGETTEVLDMNNDNGDVYDCSVNHESEWECRKKQYDERARKELVHKLIGFLVNLSGQRRMTREEFENFVDGHLVTMFGSEAASGRDSEFESDSEDGGYIPF